MSMFMKCTVLLLYLEFAPANRANAGVLCWFSCLLPVATVIGEEGNVVTKLACVELSFYFLIDVVYMRNLLSINFQIHADELKFL